MQCRANRIVSVPQNETSPIMQYGPLSAKDILEEMQDRALREPRQKPAEQAVGQPAATKQLNLPVLLAPNGRAFVEGAFSAILHRPPDAQALVHYGDQLASGAQSKIEILGQLRYSREGRKIGAKVPGLLRRYVVLHSYRLPRVGPLIGKLVRVLLWPLRLRRSHLELLSSVAVLHGTDRPAAERCRAPGAAAFQYTDRPTGCARAGD